MSICSGCTDTACNQTSTASSKGDKTYETVPMMRLLEKGDIFVDGTSTNHVETSGEVITVTSPITVSVNTNTNTNVNVNTDEELGEPFDEKYIPSTRTCPICVEHYRAGDDIAWSYNEECSHTFHRECIVQWLIHHDECPMCRSPYLVLQTHDSHPPPPTTPTSREPEQQ